MRNELRIPLLALLLAAPGLAADPAPPPTLAYQGRLLEGAAPVTGDRSFTFAILDAAGSQLWHSGPQTLAVSGGLYSAVLGSAGMPPMPSEILGRAGLKLHVTLSGPALTPDVGIIPGFQARSAWEVTGAFAGPTKFSGADGTVLGSYKIGTDHAFALAFDGTVLWLASIDGHVYRVDVSSGSQLGAYPVGQGPISMAFDGTSIWTANSNDTTVTKINVANPAIVATCTVGSMDQDWENGANPIAVAFDGAGIWVSLPGMGSVASSVKKLNIADASLVATVPAGLGVSGIAFDGANIWCANNVASGTVSRR